MLRKATPEEISLFENKIYPLQDEILSLIDARQLYLTGGTCLSRFHYQHRYSDDLDFFYDAYRFPKEDFTPVFNELVQKIKTKFPIEIHRNYDTFKRIFVKEKETSLKIEFVLEHLPVAAPTQKVRNFYVDSKINVGANKITTVYNRKKLRDFFDLFFLLQEYSLSELIKLSETKIVPLDYEGVLLALQGSFEKETVIMIKEIDSTLFLNFIKELQFQLIQYAKNIL
jgi:predicted nucleotidyltransferase component of viral defense system